MHPRHSVGPLRDAVPGFGRLAFVEHQVAHGRHRAQAPRVPPRHPPGPRRRDEAQLGGGRLLFRLPQRLGSTARGRLPGRLESLGRRRRRPRQRLPLRQPRRRRRRRRLPRELRGRGALQLGELPGGRLHSPKVCRPFSAFAHRLRARLRGLGPNPVATALARLLALRGRAAGAGGEGEGAAGDARGPLVMMCALRMKMVWLLSDFSSAVATWLHNSQAHS
mmetsp:Transcript_157099/g.504042  ORF Transcript_157099/g.504042 Transcript_157099/m.504042 type:complete len:221 (+) Transcript_157099:1266-1928(+)